MSSNWLRTVCLVLALMGLAAPLSMATPLEAHESTFAARLLEDVAQRSRKANVAISALSVADALAVLGHAADGETAAQFQKLLSPSGPPEQVASELQAAGGADGPVVVRNALWLPASMKQEPGFDVKPFNASILELPSGATEAAAKINAWASQSTQGLIKEIADPSLDTSGFVVTNATYFKGAWKYRFDPALTHPMDFYAKDQPHHSVQMMHKEDIRLRHWSEGDLEGVRLSFAGSELEYVIITSTKRATGDEILAALTAGGRLEDVCRGKGFVRSRGSLAIPRHRIDFGLDMRDTLKQLGLTSPFAPGANFSRLSATPLMLSSFRHRAVLVVDENGAEAAAATAAATTRAFEAEPTFNFVADRPFVALLVNRQAPAWPLMMTVVREL